MCLLFRLVEKSDVSRNSDQEAQLSCLGVYQNAQ